MTKSRIYLKDSKREPIPNSQPVIGVGERPDPNQHIEVTVSLRRKSSIPTWVTHSGVLSKEQLTSDYGATASDFITIQKFAQEYNLKVVEESPLTCTVKISGKIQDLERAFGTTLKHVKVGNALFRQRTGHLSVPEDVSSIIEAVLGLDNRPQANPRFVPSAISHTSQQFAAPDIARLYNFPAGDGSGQTIGIIELAGGFSPADLNTYFQGLHLATPVVSAIPVSGGTNLPTGDPNGPDGEVMLDIEIAGAIAPKAAIKVYFAPNNDKGFLDAINKAIEDMSTVISISWGGPESNWTKANMNAFEKSFQTAAGLSIPVAVASGDDGSSDIRGYDSNQLYNKGFVVRFTDNKVYQCLKNNTKNVPPGTASSWQLITPSPISADFPASAPHALGCGATHLEGSTTITKETVWNSIGGDGYFHASGGGVSTVFSKPAYQNGVTVPGAPAGGGRGVPDVCGNGAPETGYKVRVDGLNTVIGGTSAVAPLWAGLIARLAQKTGRRVPFLNPILYSNPSALSDIIVGNNDVGTGGGKYPATLGWDPCTGLGSPKGTVLLSALQGTGPTTSSVTILTTPPRTTPQTTNTNTTKPHTTNPHTTSPHTTSPHTTKPHTTNPHTTKPHTTQPHTTQPHTTEPVTSSGTSGASSAFNNWYQLPPAYEPSPVTPVAATPAPPAAQNAAIIPSVPGTVTLGDDVQTSITALVSIVATVSTTAITAITSITAIAAGKNK
jgi:kumamolisin